MRSVQLFVVCLMSLGSLACQQDHDIVDLAGRDGILRFNLQFTNEDLVDMDLHVLTPMGDEIYWAEKEGTSGGQLDLDCFCGEDNCLEGPNENIYWDYGGEAPLGTYEVWVNYFGPCDFFDEEQPSDYTLRVLKAGDVVAEYEGTLEFSGDQASYTHEE